MANEPQIWRYIALANAGKHPGGGILFGLVMVTFVVENVAIYEYLRAAGVPIGESMHIRGALALNAVIAASISALTLAVLKACRLRQRARAEMPPRKQEIIDALLAVGFRRTGQEVFEDVSENLRRGELLVGVQDWKVTIIRCRPDGTKLSRPYDLFFPLVDTAKILEMVAFLADPPRNTVRGVRKRSDREFAGLPLYDIALGADLEKGEVRGYARGIIAIGDTATGWLAVGGLVRGGLAIGGGAIGVIAIGGGALGLIGVGGLAVGGLVFGGLAVGGLAVGGGAIGLVAVGGGAIGYYAYGGGALGKYTVSFLGVNPDAAKFFHEWFPWLPRVGR